MIAIGVRMLFSDDNQASLRMAFKKIGEQCASGGPCSVPVDYVNLGDGRFEIAHVGS